MKQRIAILFHEKDRWRPTNYLINLYADFWRQDGHEVFCLYGVSSFVPANLLIVHVDLSVVPQEYLDFAARYPIVLNGHARDIRKSTYSRLLVKQNDLYEGKIIVKSNFNYAAVPERTLGVPLDSGGVSDSFFSSPLDYQIFENLKAVPSLFFNDPNLVVEKFQPERENGLYCMRAMLFLGEHTSCTRVTSRNPIVNGSTQIHTEYVQPHPDIIELKRVMKFDYGKFDYVIHEGKALLLDVNKTVGAATFPATPQRIADRRYRAEGLYGYFKSDFRLNDNAKA